MKRLFVLFFLLWSSFIFANSGADYFNEGVKAYNSGNYTKAAELFKKSCDMGNVSGCYNLGIFYDNGQGVRQSYVKAAELFKKSCDMGVAAGCYNLGILYDNGQGVRQSYVKAKEFFGKACDMGFEIGCKKYAILNKIF